MLISCRVTRNIHQILTTFDFLHETYPSWCKKTNYMQTKKSGHSLVLLSIDLQLVSFDEICVLYHWNIVSKSNQSINMILRIWMRNIYICNMQTKQLTIARKLVLPDGYKYNWQIAFTCHLKCRLSWITNIWFGGFEKYCYCFILNCVWKTLIEPRFLHKVAYLYKSL